MDNNNKQMPGPAGGSPFSNEETESSLRMEGEGDPASNFEYHPRRDDRDAVSTENLHDELQDEWDVSDNLLESIMTSVDACLPPFDLAFHSFFPEVVSATSDDAENDVVMNSLTESFHFGGQNEGAETVTDHSSNTPFKQESPTYSGFHPFCPEVAPSIAANAENGVQMNPPILIFHSGGQDDDLGPENTMGCSPHTPTEQESPSYSGIHPFHHEVAPSTAANAENEASMNPPILTFNSDVQDDGLGPKNTMGSSPHMPIKQEQPTYSGFCQLFYKVAPSTAANSEFEVTMKPTKGTLYSCGQDEGAGAESILDLSYHSSTAGHSSTNDAPNDSVKNLSTPITIDVGGQLEGTMPESVPGPSHQTPPEGGSVRKKPLPKLVGAGDLSGFACARVYLKKKDSEPPKLPRFHVEADGKISCGVQTDMGYPGAVVRLIRKRDGDGVWQCKYCGLNRQKRFCITRHCLAKHGIVRFGCPFPDCGKRWFYSDAPERYNHHWEMTHTDYYIIPWTVAMYLELPLDYATDDEEDPAG